MKIKKWVASSGRDYWYVEMESGGLMKFLKRLEKSGLFDGKSSVSVKGEKDSAWDDANEAWVEFKPGEFDAGAVEELFGSGKVEKPDSVTVIGRSGGKRIAIKAFIGGDSVKIHFDPEDKEMVIKILTNLGYMKNK